MNSSRNTSQNNSWIARYGRGALVTGIVCAVLVIGLAFDLSQRGAVWNVFWSLTGEETPVAQLRGMVEWAGNFTRPQPTLDPYALVQHAGVNPFGMNTFLEAEVEPAKRERQVQMIADAGFAWIRQQFIWQDIEIHARGDFTDRRNDIDGDGQIDTIDAWAKYDQIVELAENYDLDILARLDNPPAWAQPPLAEGETPTAGRDFAPPSDFGDFARYAAAVAERYRGRIRYYQIWNEPNIYPEWGENGVDPEAYTELLCAAYRAIKAVDSNAVVLSGALSPTVALTDRDLNDFIYLQRMYDAGAADCFDVLAVQGYGFFSGPTDQRMRPTTLNFARNLYMRELMVADGDSEKAVWITEAAWNPIDSFEVPPDVSGRENYGVVTREQAAAYLPLAYERAEREWSWVGMVAYWFFKRPHEQDSGQSWYYFRMVEPDFTPLPIYNAMQRHLAGYIPRLYRGVHQADHYAITYAGEQARVTVDDAQFGDAVDAEFVAVLVVGTEVIVRWQGETLSARVDGEAFTFTGDGNWNETTIAQSFVAREYDIALEAVGDDLLRVDSLTVYDHSTRNLTPIILGTVVVVGMFGWAVLAGLRERR